VAHICQVRNHRLMKHGPVGFDTEYPIIERYRAGGSASRRPN
jgi:hypothetical protein